MSQQPNGNNLYVSINQPVAPDPDINMEPTIGIVFLITTGFLSELKQISEEQILMELEKHLEIHREFGSYRETASAKLDCASGQLEWVTVSCRCFRNLFWQHPP